jgi:prepilin-type N-terminal cleavage/methylation domain-containing protein
MAKNIKGFTIIELIVVIAIIAVLAGIVLVNVSGYNNKAKIAAIKANMRSLNTTATRYFERNGDFGDLCSDPDVSKVTASIDKIQGSGFAECTSNENPHSYAGTCDTSQWLYVSFLINFAGGLWCVDYTGNSKFESSISGVGSCKCL